MNIGVNSRIYQNSNTGIPYYIYNLYKTLLKLDSKNKYIFFQTNDKKTIGKTVISFVPNNQIGILFFETYQIFKQAIKNNIRVLHGPSNTLPLFKPPHMKYVVTIHDLFFLQITNSTSSLFKYYYKFLIKRSLDLADVVVADSENTKNDIIKFYGISSSKIKVVYLGVKEIYFQKNSTSRLIRENYFFSITTHPERKNIISVLKVMSRNSDLQKLKYVIAGLIPNDQLVELKHTIHELGLDRKVIIYGYGSEDDLKNLYQHAEFFIFPSFYEGFGFPVLEAMACGCPVITSNTSSLPEITPNKDWLIDPYDIADLSLKITAILSLSKIDRTKLIEKNYKFAKQFTWEKSANLMLDIFEKLG